MELSAAVTEIGKGMTSGPDKEDLFMIIATRTGCLCKLVPLVNG